MVRRPPAGPSPSSRPTTSVPRSSARSRARPTRAPPPPTPSCAGTTRACSTARPPTTGPPPPAPAPRARCESAIAKAEHEASLLASAGWTSASGTPSLERLPAEARRAFVQRRALEVGRLLRAKLMATRAVLGRAPPELYARTRARLERPRAPPRRRRQTRRRQRRRDRAVALRDLRRRRGRRRRAPRPRARHRRRARRSRQRPRPRRLRRRARRERRRPRRAGELRAPPAAPPHRHTSCATSTSRTTGTACAATPASRASSGEVAPVAVDLAAGDC